MSTVVTHGQRVTEALNEAKAGGGDGALRPPVPVSAPGAIEPPVICPMTSTSCGRGCVLPSGTGKTHCWSWVEAMRAEGRALRDVGHGG